MEAIKVTDLDVAYEQKYIIKNMNLEIPKGKITMIIGSNGCGKSTLLKTIARIITPKKGEIQLFNNKHQKRLLRKWLSCHKVQLFPQVF